MPSTIIIGAGWAGLSCAYSLTKAGHEVTLIDAAPQVGGRARGVSLQEMILDNGQHICIGAYHTLRQLLVELGLDETQLFKILDMELIVYSDRKVRLKLPKLPAPFNLLSGICTAHHISWRDKYKILKFCYHVYKLNFLLEHDCTVLELMKNYHQSDFIIKHLWEPIALAAMTTPINQASAQIFLNILRSVFYHRQQDSNWYLPTTDLSSLLPTHLENYLLHNGAQIIYGHTIKQSHYAYNKCSGVSSNTMQWQADNFVLAIPPWQAAKLLQPHAELIAVHSALSNFKYQAITTIYFAFSAPVKLEYPMLSLINSTCQWIFDRALVGQAHVISAVISGSGPHQQLTQAELASQVLKEIQTLLPHLKSPIWQQVIQEYRPLSKTTISNLWLTGDYLQTGLPATLEGALLSGRTTAQNISPRSNHNC